MSTQVSIQSAPKDSKLHLPKPPTDDEKYWYLKGSQLRWLMYVQAVVFFGVAYSIFRFAFSTAWTLLMLGPLFVFASTLMISVRSSTRRRLVTYPDHQAAVELWAPAHYPSVDVFLPTAGEDLRLLENTFRYVSRLEYDEGTLNTYVLDDSGRDQVRELAEQFGFSYLARPDRGRLKKAGNLAYGYRHSDGEFIAIFDADFVPRPEYLHELLPYFDNERAGIVQSPQFFSTTRRMNWIERCAGATQELFYRFVQPSRDSADAAICVGTCAVYRRAALDKAGGFAQIGHSEDVHTGVNMIVNGYKVQYVPVIVSRGVCPDNLTSFVTQQYRWCTGSLTLLKNPGFHTAALTRRQRLSFWSGFMYYVGTGIAAFTSPIPALLMVWFFRQDIFLRNVYPLLGIPVVWFLVLPLVFKSRFRAEVMRIQTVYGFAHASAAYHLIHDRTAEWVATGSTARNHSAQAVRRTMFWYLGVTQTLITIGLVIATLEYGIGRTWGMAAFALFRWYITGPLIWETAVDGAESLRALFSRRAVPTTIDLRI